MTQSTADATTYSDSLSDSNRSNTRDDTSSQEEDDGSVRLTQKWIKELFKKEWKTYYRTPELNNKLYFHYKGFKKIENLEQFTELLCLYMEGNGIQKLEGFSGNTRMRSLYLQENLMEKMENLEVMPELVQLNLSDNLFKTIEGLENNKKLDSLYMKRNKIGINGISDLVGLLDCPSISCLDLSENRIDDPAVLDEIFVKMPNLRVLYMGGNGCIKKIPNYRKTVISKIPTLKYLDDRPVFDEDRRHAEAFARGGIEEERKERATIKKENEEYHEKNRQAFRDMIAKARAEKAAKVKEQMTEAEKNKIDQQVEESVQKGEKAKDKSISLEQLQKAQQAMQPESGSASNDDDVTEENPPELEQVDLEEEKRKQQLLELTKQQQQKEWFDRVTKQQQEREQAAKQAEQPKKEEPKVQEVTEEKVSEQIDTTEAENKEEENQEIDFEEMD